MTNFETHDKNDVDLPAVLRLLGVDSTGMTHQIDPTTQTVYATDDESVVVVDVSDRTVQSYVDHFADARGWDELRYDDRPFDEWLLDALELAPAQEVC